MSWKMDQDDLVNKYQDKIQQMQGTHTHTHTHTQTFMCFLCVCVCAAYCQEKADKLEEAQNNYQAKKVRPSPPTHTRTHTHIDVYLPVCVCADDQSGYEADREECLKQLERILSRIETIQVYTHPHTNTCGCTSLSLSLCVCVCVCLGERARGPVVH